MSLSIPSIPAPRRRAVRAPRRAQPVGQAPAQQGARSWADTRVGAKIFAVSATLNLIAGWFLEYVWGIGNADALSRTTNASYVLFSRDPHLASIGFVWPVLPSILQLPLLPVLHALGHPEFAGPIVSSLAGAGTMVVLAAILGRFGVTGWTRLLWLLPVQLHPQFLYLASNGMSEPLSIFFLMLAVLAFLSVTTDVLAPSALGLSLAGAFFVRYEVLSTTAAVALALLVQRWALPEARGALASAGDGPPGRLSRLIRQDWFALEGLLLTALAPICFAAGLWILANWMIMGDPLFFDHGVFSLAKAPDVPINNGPGYALHAQIHSAVLSLGYAAWRLVEVNLTLPIVALPALALAVKQKDRRLLGLLIIVFGTFALPTYEVFKGTLPGYMRYWSLATPFAVAVAGALVGLMAAMRAGWSRWARPARYAVAALLFLSAGVNVVALARDGLNSGDEHRLGNHLIGNARADDGPHGLLQADFNYQKHQDGAILAPLLDRYSAHGLTLIDTETGFSAILYARHPERLAISSDRDFRRILADPRRYLSYILATDPRVGKERDVISQRFGGEAHPLLYDGKLPWTREVAQAQGTIEPWKVFAVESYDGRWPAGVPATPAPRRAATAPATRAARPSSIRVVAPAAAAHASNRWVFFVARVSGVYAIPRLVVLNPTYRALRVTARVYDRRGRLLRVASMLLVRRGRLTIDPGRLAPTSPSVAHAVVVRSRLPVVVEQQDT